MERVLQGVQVKVISYSGFGAGEGGGTVVRRGGGVGEGVDCSSRRKGVLWKRRVDSRGFAERGWMKGCRRAGSVLWVFASPRRAERKVVDFGGIVRWV